MLLLKIQNDPKPDYDKGTKECKKMFNISLRKIS